jgi:hypothetical protein
LLPARSEPRLRAQTQRYKDGRSKGTSVISDGEFLPEPLGRLERELATNASYLWEGFVAFCEESVSVPAESVVAVLGPVTDRIEDLKSRA